MAYGLSIVNGSNRISLTTNTWIQLDSIVVEANDSINKTYTQTFTESLVYTQLFESPPIRGKDYAPEAVLNDVAKRLIVRPYPNHPSKKALIMVLVR